MRTFLDISVIQIATQVSKQDNDKNKRIEKEARNSLILLSGLTLGLLFCTISSIVNLTKSFVSDEEIGWDEVLSHWILDAMAILILNTILLFAYRYNRYVLYMI